MKTFSFWLLLFCHLFASSQTWLNDKYWVQFTDKANTPYTLSNPSAYLSQRALDRRNHYHIRIDSTDLPITPAYILAVANLGAPIFNQSKWLNAVTIHTTDTNVVKQIAQLPFVTSVTHTHGTLIQAYDEVQQQAIVKVANDDQYYGGSYNQVAMINGNYLHELGYWGEGMQIAVLDAGFSNADQMGVFDSLRDNNRILGTWDFVHQNANVYTSADHGRNVLSIIAGNQPGTYVGAAPRASYYLFITEDVSSESKAEEGNWIAAAEVADSLGVDMITTSLGYTQFDDTSTSYHYSDMDGHTARISRGANAAARKGILVVCSAGNEGGSAWHYISAPADADSVMAVAAVSPTGKWAYFSSLGPDYNGTIKPNIAGQGQYTAYVNDRNVVAVGSGTSYSAPLIAGFTACLWQTSLDKSNMDIIENIEHTASQANNPDDSVGFGIANFERAFSALVKDKVGTGIYNVEQYPLAFPNPFTSNLSVMLFAGDGGNHQIEVFDAKGAKVYDQTIAISSNSFYRVDLSALNPYSNGVYLVRVHTPTSNQVVRVVKF